MLVDCERRHRRHGDAGNQPVRKRRRREVRSSPAGSSRAPQTPPGATHPLSPSPAPVARRRPRPCSPTSRPAAWPGTSPVSPDGGHARVRRRRSGPARPRTISSSCPVDGSVAPSRFIGSVAWLRRHRGHLDRGRQAAHLDAGAPSTTQRRAAASWSPTATARAVRSVLAQGRLDDGPRCSSSARANRGLDCSAAGGRYRGRRGRSSSWRSSPCCRPSPRMTPPKPPKPEAALRLGRRRRSPLPRLPRHRVGRARARRAAPYGRS